MSDINTQPENPTTPEAIKPPVPLLDLKAQYEKISAAIDAAIRRVVQTQTFILGPEVKAFEEEMAKAIGSPYAIACASGSDALLLALMALDLEPGSEIITTPYTFFATAGSIVRLGLKPVFCDIEPGTFNIDPAKMAACITPRTRVILPVHIFGQCADMAPILMLAEEHGLAVIEDAAQAIGARYRGAGAGTIGDIGCFSFFPSKNLGGYGDGGLMTTTNVRLAARLRALRTHGSTQTYLHEWVGVNSRLDALQAAILRVKLPYLDSWSDARAANADRYRRFFTEAGLAEEGTLEPQVGRVVLPPAVMERHVYNQFVIRVQASRRNELRGHLQACQIGSAVYYPLPLHLQPCFHDLGYHEGDLPVAELAAKETLALPVFPELSEAQQRQVVGEIKAFLQSAGAKV